MEQYITLEDAKKKLSKAKPNQPIEVVFRSTVKAKRSWEKATDESRLWKVTRVNTVTNCNYGDIKAQNEIAAGNFKEVPDTPEEKKREPIIYNTVVPHMIEERNGKYYLILYPSQKWQNSSKQYTIWDADDNCVALYDTLDEIADFVLPSWLNSHQTATDGKEFKLQDYMRIPLNNIYELNLQ